MNVRLPPDPRKKLEKQLAAGADDLAWAKPYVDEARSAAARGEVAPLDEALADIDAHLAELKR
jgi:hypothetical protein